MLFLSFYAFGSLALLLVWMSARSYRLRMVRAATMAEERRREEMEEEMKIKEAPMKRKVFIQSFHDCKICKVRNPSSSFLFFFFFFFRSSFCAVVVVLVVVARHRTVRPCREHTVTTEMQ